MSWEYTQADIDALIACQKRIVTAPKKTMLPLHGSKRNNMMVTNDEHGDFSVFMRVNEAFSEDFSIGIKHEPKTHEGIILARFNGPHGNFVNPGMEDHPHFGYHIHLASEESIRLKIRPEAGGTLTSDFASYDQALRYFLKYLRIQWNDTHFPGLSQRELFNDE